MFHLTLLSDEHRYPVSRNLYQMLKAQFDTYVFLFVAKFKFPFISR